MNTTIKYIDLLKSGTKIVHADVLPIFARHETFHPRFGWLKKGFDKAIEDCDVFLKDDAPIKLGVGKNMARAIRYWCYAFKILKERTSEKISRKCYPTKFGVNLLGNKGWDPYLENPASLWLLHWNLLKQPCYAATWYFVFNVYRHIEFTPDFLLNALSEYKERIFPTQKAVLSSLNKDINCLTRMYVKRNSQGILEDTIDSPFSDLELIKSSGDANSYYFKIGDKTGLVPEIVVATCLEFIAAKKEGGTTISISRLLFDISSPGLIFKLSESGLCSAIEKVASKRNDIFLSESSGILQLVYTRDPEILANEILGCYYQEGI